MARTARGLAEKCKEIAGDLTGANETGANELGFLFFSFFFFLFSLFFSFKRLLVT